MKTIKIFLSLMLMTTLVWGQDSPFTLATTDVAKLEKKAITDFPSEGRTTDNGNGWSTNIKVLGAVPKRVALVTYYMEDPGSSDTKKGSYTTTSTAWMTATSTISADVQAFYDLSIEPLKKAFSSYGMQLLTPSEFLDTPVKKQFYESFQVQHGSLRKTKETSKIIEKAGVLELDRFRGTPSGYKPIIIANEKPSFNDELYKFKMGSNESKFFESMGYDLATGLGVDAVVAIYIVARKPEQFKNSTAINHVRMFMWGPNPIQKPAEEDGVFYTKGQFYAGASISWTNPILYRVPGKKKAPSTATLNGMENVMTALTQVMGNYFNEKLSK